MTVLVTGATGFIGGRLAHRLLEEGRPVRLLVRRPDAAAELEAAGASLVQGALEDEASLVAAMRGARVVFHCAGLSTDWAPWADFERVNVAGSQRLAQAAARAGTVERLVHLSSTDVYGYPPVACGDDTAPRDVGLPYNRSKLRGELAVQAVARATGLPLTIIRPATVYGPRSKDWAVELGKLLSRRELVLVSSGRAGAGLLYVDNLVDALFKAERTPAAAGRTYTLRDATSPSWGDYLSGLATGLGVPPPRWSLPLGLALVLGRLSEVGWKLALAKRRPLITRHAALVLGRDQNYGTQRAVEELGFVSRVPYAEGLQRTVAWLQSEEGRRALAT